MTLGRLKTIVLLIWAAFFGWLLFSGEVYRYIGPRTYWVVIFGVVCLGAVAFGNLVLTMRSDASRASPRQVMGFVTSVVPIILVLLIPKPSLGSLAVSRKMSGGIVAAAIQPSAADPGGEVSFQEVTLGTESPEYAAALGLADGYPLELTGFVSDAAIGVPDAFPLTRFSIFCCAADATPYTVPVRAPVGTPDFPRDTWLEVEGALFLDGDEWVLEAERIDEVAEPSNPYI